MTLAIPAAVTQILTELRHVAAEYGRGTCLGPPHVFVSPPADSIVVEFPMCPFANLAEGMRVEIDIDLMRMPRRHWEDVARFELQRLLDRAERMRRYRDEPAFYVRGDGSPLSKPSSTAPSSVGNVAMYKGTPAPPPDPRPPTRDEKIKQAMAGIDRGEHLAPSFAPTFEKRAGYMPPSKRWIGGGGTAPDPLGLTEKQRGAGAANAFEAFELNQREGGTRIGLSPEQRAAASAEWSRRLGELAAAAVQRERHQVLVDIQDEP